MCGGALARRRILDAQIHHFDLCGDPRLGAAILPNRAVSSGAPRPRWGSAGPWPVLEAFVNDVAATWAKHGTNILETMATFTLIAPIALFRWPLRK